jgi:hypothetical protein
MKNILKFYNDHKEEFLVFLMINIIVLLLMNLFANSKYITVKDVLTAATAVSSSFFIFLAFKETQKGNKLKINDKVYEYFKNDIDEILKEGDERLLHDDSVDFIYSVCKYSKDMLQRINCYNFDYHFSEIIKLTMKDNEYLTLIKYLGENFTKQLPVNSPTFPNGELLSWVYQRLSLCTSSVYYYYKNMYETCERIHESSLEREHKEILIEMVLQNNGNFYEFSKRLINNSEEVKLLQNFIAFKSNKGELQAYIFFNFDQFIDVYDNMERLSKIYFAEE